MTTPANQPDLAAWLRQQLDTDERVATDAENNEDARRWSASDDPWSGRVLDGNGDIVVYDEGSPSFQEATHIARHDPARVLAEVEAKRRIMAIHNRRADAFPALAGGPFDNCCDGCGFEGPCEDPVTEDINDCPILRLLALPYADRPGYREEWRP